MHFLAWFKFFLQTFHKVQAQYLDTNTDWTVQKYVWARHWVFPSPFAYQEFLPITSLEWCHLRKGRLYNILMRKRKQSVGGIDKRYSLVDLLYYLLQILSTQISFYKMPRVAKNVSSVLKMLCESSFMHCTQNEISQ